MRLLVTRPQSDATELIELLENAGHSTNHFPLLDIEFLSPKQISLHGYQASLITSANGARSLAKNVSVSDLSDMLAITVGPASATAAKQAGFTNITQTSVGDVSGIIDYVTANLSPQNGPLLYPSGAKTTGDLEQVLAKHGFSVHREILYKAQRASALPSPLVDQLNKGMINGVLLFSPRTAKIWISLTKGCIDKPRLAKLGHFCLSQNVADVMYEHLGSDCDIKISKKPDTQHMLASINASTK